jgi:hypothetical protein
MMLPFLVFADLTSTGFFKFSSFALPASLAAAGNNVLHPSPKLELFRRPKTTHGVIALASNIAPEKSLP